MNAEIISIGTEILLGEIVDTNSAYIASRLPALGIDLYLQAHRRRQPRAPRRGHAARARARRPRHHDRRPRPDRGRPHARGDRRRHGRGAVRSTPTSRPGCAASSPAAASPMPERNLKQAWLIPSARAIPNPRGTAPGWWVGARRQDRHRDARPARGDDAHVGGRGRAGAAARASPAPSSSRAPSRRPASAKATSTR